MAATMEARKIPITEANRRLVGAGLTSIRRASEELEAFLAAFGTETTDLEDRSSLIPHKEAGVTPAAVAAPTVVQSKMIVPTPTPTAVQPVMTTVEGPATAKLELLCSVPLSKIPGLSFKPAAVPGEARTVSCWHHNKFGAAALKCGGGLKGRRCDWVRMTVAKPSIGWSERDCSRSHKHSKSRDRSRSHKRTESRDHSKPRDRSRSHKRTKSRDRSKSQDRSRSHKRTKSGDCSKSRNCSRSLRRGTSRDLSGSHKFQGHMKSRGPHQDSSLGNGNPSKGAKSPKDHSTVGDIQRGLDTVEVMPLSGSSLDPRKKGPTLLSISQPINIYEQKPWLGGIWLSSLPEAPVVVQSPTRAPSSSEVKLPIQAQVQAPVQNLAPSQTEVDILPTSPPSDEAVTELKFRLPFGWRKTGTRRSTPPRFAAATPNVRAIWNWALYSPSGKRLKSRGHLLPFLANNPEVPFDPSVTHHGCLWNKAFRRKSSDLEAGKGVGRAQKKLPRLNLFK